MSQGQQLVLVLGLTPEPEPVSELEQGSVSAPEAVLVQVLVLVRMLHAKTEPVAEPELEQELL